MTNKLGNEEGLSASFLKRVDYFFSSIACRETSSQNRFFLYGFSYLNYHIFVSSFFSHLFQSHNSSVSKNKKLIFLLNSGRRNYYKVCL